MSAIKCYSTSELRFTAKCDFCSKSADYLWLLFESQDGTNHICNECVDKMMETMYCIADGCDGEAVD